MILASSKLATSVTSFTTSNILVRIDKGFNFASTLIISGDGDSEFEQN